MAAETSIPSTIKEDKAKAKTFFDIASGQVTTLDDYVDGWLLSIEHLKARTIKQMKRDVDDFLNGNDNNIILILIPL